MTAVKVALAIAVATLAMPAAAATWAFGGTAGTATSYTTTRMGVPTNIGPATVSLTANARRFTPLPTALTNVSQLISTTTPGNANLLVDRTTTSIGVVGGANTQLDTNNANQYEALYITANNLLSLKGLVLSAVDVNDTLQVYGVNATTGALTDLGFGGRIASGLGGAASFSNAPFVSSNTTTTLTFTNTMMNFFSGYVFTTRNPGNVLTDGDLGQGYRINSITADVLPEPGSWALLIIGFGFTGAAMRRRAPAAA